MAAHRKCTKVGENEARSGRMAQEPGGQSITIFMKSRGIRVVDGFAFRRKGEINLGRQKCTEVGENDARVGKTAPSSGDTGRRPIA